MVKECSENKKAFGIPAVIDNRLQERGTLVSVTEITKLYDNGEMDIKTKGERVFRMLEIIKEVPDKLYSGAIVNYPDNKERGDIELMRRVMNGIRELHKLLNVSKDFKKPDEELKTYEVAHHVGLTLSEEYELLGLFDELQRQEYLKRHLTKVLPLVAEMEGLKEKIKQNGHFKNLSGFQFEW